VDRCAVTSCTPGRPMAHRQRRARGGQPPAPPVTRSGKGHRCPAPGRPLREARSRGVCHDLNAAKAAHVARKGDGIVTSISCLRYALCDGHVGEAEDSTVPRIDGRLVLSLTDLTHHQELRHLTALDLSVAAGTRTAPVVAVDRPTSWNGCLARPASATGPTRSPIRSRPALRAGLRGGAKIRVSELPRGPPQPASCRKRPRPLARAAQTGCVRWRRPVRVCVTPGQQSQDTRSRFRRRRRDGDSL